MNKINFQQKFFDIVRDLEFTHAVAANLFFTVRVNLTIFVITYASLKLSSFIYIYISRYMYSSYIYIYIYQGHISSYIYIYIYQGHISSYIYIYILSRTVISLGNQVLYNMVFIVCIMRIDRPYENRTLTSF